MNENCCSRQRTGAQGMSAVEPTAGYRRVPIACMVEVLAVVAVRSGDEKAEASVAG